MSALLILATTITLGTRCAGPCPDPSVFDWEIRYADGVVEAYATDAPELTLVPRAGRAFSAFTRVNGSGWSAGSIEMLVDPLTGDTNFDCQVGIPDLLSLQSHFGQGCP